MELKKLLHPAVAAIMLSGCGGGDSKNTSTPPTTTPNPVTIQVIDGYIGNAEVYEDCDGDHIPDGVALGVTDSSGKFELADYQKGCSLIADIQAGLSKDMDRAGLSKISYQMMTGEGGTVISPYTTLAKLNNQDVVGLAQEMGIDPDLASGDFVAGTNGEAGRLQALARGVASTLPKNLQVSPQEADNLKILANEALSRVDYDSLAGMDVKKMDYYHHGGQFVGGYLQQSINDFLVGVRPTEDFVYEVSLNKSMHNNDNMSTFHFSEDGLLTTLDGFIASYSTDGDSMRVNSDQPIDWAGWDFIYTHYQLAVAMSVDNTNGYETIGLISKQPLTTFRNFTAAEGTVLYFVADTSSQGVTQELSMLTLELKGGNRATLTSNTGLIRESRWVSVVTRPKASFASQDYEAIYLNDLDVIIFKVLDDYNMTALYLENGPAQILGNSSQYILASEEKDMIERIYKLGTDIISR